MKMIYMTPTTSFVDTEVEAIMATSIQQRGDGNLEQDLGNAGTTDATSGNLSRRRSQWDDEDLDEN